MIFDFFFNNSAFSELSLGILLLIPLIFHCLLNFYRVFLKPAEVISHKNSTLFTLIVLILAILIGIISSVIAIELSCFKVCSSELDSKGYTVLTYATVISISLVILYAKQRRSILKSK